jgi:hypothetical protein
LPKIINLLLYLYRKFNKINVLKASFIAFLAIVAAMSVMSSVYISEKSSLTFVLEFCRSKNDFLSVVNQLGPEGISGYKKLLLIDSVFPFVYSIFLCSTIALVSSRKEEEISDATIFFFSLPLAGGFLDLVENFTHLLLLADLSAITDKQVIFSAMVSAVKWALPAISTLYVAVILAKLNFGKANLQTARRLEKD